MAIRVRLVMLLGLGVISLLGTLKWYPQQLARSSTTTSSAILEMIDEFENAPGDWKNAKYAPGPPASSASTARPTSSVGSSESTSLGSQATHSDRSSSRGHVVAGADLANGLRKATEPSSLRFYVHRLPERLEPQTLVKKHGKCKNFQWSNDFKFLNRVQTGMTTSSTTEADFFLVPFLSKCYFNFEAVYRLEKMEHAFSLVMKALEATDAWKRWPERHLFIFSSGVGPTLVPSWQKVRKGIFILAEGDRSAGFYENSKDLVIPGVGKATGGKISQQELHRPRQLLACFRGTLIRGHARDKNGKDVFCRSLLRQALLNLARGRKDVVINERRYTDASTLDKKAYKHELAGSTFCIIPRGLTPWTSRLFDAIALDCIPVILSNAIVFPFERSIDYSKFTIKLPESWVSHLWSLLESIPRQQVRALQVRVREAAPMFLGKGPIDAVLSELVKARSAGMSGSNGTRNGVNIFWMPGRGTFELQGNEARQVGPSYSAGAEPHPSASELWVPDEKFKKLVGKLWDEENCVPCPTCKYGQWNREIDDS